MESIGADAAFMAAAAGKAFVTLMEPHRLMYLMAGCMMGLVLGIVPGIGGLAGTAMLLPFTFGMDPYSAFALLLGLGATTATGDPIPAILFGVPGGAASAATVLDGFPMAKRGEAGRALSAAYMSSMMGGIFGAMLLAGVDPDPAAGDALSRFARAVGVFRLGHIDGGRLVGQRPVAGRCRRLSRHHDRDDRVRSADRHAALDDG
jgi:TctA family transporter